MVIKIELSKHSETYAGQYDSLIDDIDADLAKSNWNISTRRNKYGVLFYADRNVNKKEYYSGKILLHRVILERKLGRKLDRREYVDHIDGDGLNNTRDNIRLATPSQNSINKRMQSNNTSGVRGVCWNGRKWQAEIKVKGQKKLYLGQFDTIEEAAAVYQKRAVKLFGEYINPTSLATVPQPERTPIQLPLFALDSEVAA
jgi:hypothetical protein